MRKLLWRIYLGIVKPQVKLIHWIIRKKGNNYILYEFGDLLLYMEETYPGKRTEGFRIVSSYLVNTGLAYMDEAVHNEANNIKTLYDIDMETDIDEVSEDIIEEYFGERIRG